MTHKQFESWCNERACDGMWGMVEAMICVDVIRRVDSVKAPGLRFFNKRNTEAVQEKEWQKINSECNIEWLVSEMAHNSGIKTWVSHEPVYEPKAVYLSITDFNFIDLYKIGKLNYYPSDINWGEFGRECERLCKAYDRNYYIKEDLRKEMER